jgi:hypothetical protein
MWHYGQGQAHKVLVAKDMEVPSRGACNGARAGEMVNYISMLCNTYDTQHVMNMLCNMMYNMLYYVMYFNVA